jgi:hypothetical protein
MFQELEQHLSSDTKGKKDSTQFAIKKTVVVHWG